MEQNSQVCDEIDLDISRFIRVIVKHKISLMAVLLFVLAMGSVKILSAPKIYKISMMIQPPVAGESLTGADDLESAESLKGLIINGAFDEELKKKLGINLNTGPLGFAVVIPEKTNILEVSIKRVATTKEFGIVLLQNLYDLISTTYAKRIDVKNENIDNQIKQKELAISNAKDRIDNFQVQINEISAREEKLTEEAKTAKSITSQMLTKRDELLKNNANLGSVSDLLLTNFLQNNSSYLNQLNNQFSELSIRRANLDLQIKDTESQISDFQMLIDKFNRGKLFVSNLKIIAQPRVSPNPISPSKKKILVISMVMGLFIGLLAVFLQEFWVNNSLKK